MKLCTVPDCTGPHYAKGRCRRHYEAWRDTTDEKPRCSLDGCDRTAVCRGWCGRHYQRWRKHGSLDMPVKATPKKKPASKLPPGWFKPTPRSSERMTTNHVERVDTLLPLESTSMAIVRQHAPAMRAKLAARFGADSDIYAELADILGVAS